MLGRLLSSAASSLNPSAHGTPSSTRPSTSLESVQEEIHTRNLLFPDASLLHQPNLHLYPLSGGSVSPTGAAASGFDCYGDLDLESPRDVRILIAQDATASQGKAVLYDSNPLLITSPKPASTFHGAHNPVSGLEHAQPLSSAGIASAGFLRTRRRGTMPTSNPTDTYQNQCAGSIKPEDEIKVLTDCMFGSAPLSYKGSSTKVHIIPTVAKSQSRSVNASPVIGSDGQGSFGRSEGRRRSHLAQSYTPNNIPSGSKTTSSTSPTNKGAERKTVLITRLFSVAVQAAPSIESRDHTPTPQNSVGSTNSFPFPRMSGASAPPPSKLSKVPRTAMYAIGLIIQLPASSQSISATASRSGLLPNTGWRMSNSSHGHEMFSSSFEADKRTSSMFIDPSFGLDVPSPMGGDADDRMEIIAQHWDVITRTLSSLQSVAQEQIVETLKQAELASPPTIGNVSRTRRTIELWPGALTIDEIVKREVEIARLRVVLGLRVPRVVTGQGRWGVWREEARWVGRWAGGKEQNFFFFNLLTAFLGNHTEWLDALGPPWYRRRHQQQQKANSNEDLAIPSRTVIVATDKMAARRLIFLLSAFLPAASNAGDSLSPFRPVTSSSRGYSQSPPMPSFMRKESLRRTINKRANVPRSTPQAEGQTRASNVSTYDSNSDHLGEDAITVINNGRSHSRRSSDTRSLRSLRSKNLPIPSTNGATSATTTTTVTPATTVPHFATLPSSLTTTGTAAEPRPGSSGSLASLNLMHTLKRNNSTGLSGHSTETTATSGSLWGSLISGFWSNRRDSSAEDSVATTATDPDGLGISGVPRAKITGPLNSSSKLEEMVAEKSPTAARDDGELYQHDLLEDDEAPPPGSRTGGHPPLDNPPTSTSFPRQISGTPPSQGIPTQPKILESPLKLSVDEHDGVVDVDIQLPSFLSATAGPSLGSPISSPSTAGFMSVASLDAGAGGASSSFGQTSACPFSSLDPETPVNVAGWLRRFHADFALQAVNPYPGLVEDVKASMRAEPTPTGVVGTPGVEPNGPGGGEKWVDVCSVLVADTRTFSITRLRLKRRVKLAPPANGNRPTSSASSPSRPADNPTTLPSQVPQRSQYGNPYHPAHLHPGLEMLAAAAADGATLEERLDEEAIMDMDPTLIDAVEKIIAQSHHGQSTHTHSRSRNGNGGRRTSNAAAATAATPGEGSGASSRSSSRRGRTGRRGSLPGEGEGPRLEIPRAECKDMVLGALEQVVRSVARDRGASRDGGVELGGGGYYHEQGLGKEGGGGGVAFVGLWRKKVETESTLREGVRKWLHDVEEAP